MKQALQNVISKITAEESSPRTSARTSPYIYTVSRIALSFLLLVLVSNTAFAHLHFKGGHFSYNHLGEGLYEVFSTSYWDKNYVEKTVPRYSSPAKVRSFPLTVSQTLLPDGETVEHVQRQEVYLPAAGVYEVYWKTCCRDTGANFDHNETGLFAAIHHNPAVLSTSAKFYDYFDLNFSIEQPVDYRIHMEHPEGWEQEFSLEIPYGLPADAYTELLEAGFQLMKDGTILWEKPVAGSWLLTVRLREKINGSYTGGYIDRDYIININCSEIITNYNIIAQPCTGSNNGKISLSTAGGVSPYYYSLDNGLSYQSNADFKNLAAGDYTAIVKDANDCISEPLAIALEEATLPEVTLELPEAICANAGAMELNGGNPAGGHYEGTAVADGFFYPEDAGVGTHIIYYTYTDRNGCSNTVSQEIRVNEAPLADAGADTEVYSGAGAKACTTLTAGATGGTSPYTYYWSTGETSQTIEVCPAETTTYALTVTDAAGCSDTSQVTVTVQAPGSGGSNGNQPDGAGKENKPDDVGKGNNRGKAANARSIANAADSIPVIEPLAAGILIFPNPLKDKGQLKVSLEEADWISVEIIDLSGKLVKRVYTGNIGAKQTLSFEINSKSLGNRNIYMARLITTKGVQAVRLMIQ